MHGYIEHLVNLQAIDLKREELARAAQALPGAMSHAEAALRSAQQKATNASDALSREESLRTRMERDVDQLRKKASHFSTQQDSVKTPAQAQAIEHEVQFAQQEIKRLEDEEYASLERSETQESVLAAARAEVEDMAGALEKTHARIAARQEEIASEQRTLDAERNAVRQAIEPEWLSRFDRIAASRGTGLARAENQQCMSCRMGLRPQVWNQLREGELLTCDSCGRLIYWDPAMAPAPKSPQPEAPAGAGRAIRKPSQAGT
ncbi:MAG TPA: C4-type zinc ribbon domain-containing protein [Terracidiphilus sp.]|nr:C4-type zinc ribbon domain-containing protein [Terracidiphilus sp.]